MLKIIQRICIHHGMNLVVGQSGNFIKRNNRKCSDGTVVDLINAISRIKTFISNYRRI